MVYRNIYLVYIYTHIQLHFFQSLLGRFPKFPPEVSAEVVGVCPDRRGFGHVALRCLVTGSGGLSYPLNFGARWNGFGWLEVEFIDLMFDVFSI